jgi:hypothetical protein
MWQLEAIVQEAGNDGSITSIDALNVRLDNQVCCTVFWEDDLLVFMYLFTTWLSYINMYMAMRLV